MIEVQSWCVADDYDLFIILEFGVQLKAKGASIICITKGLIISPSVWSEVDSFIK